MPIFEYDNYQKKSRLSEFIHSLSDTSPLELSEKIRSLGYIGQDEAVKSVSLFAFRHIRRIKKMYIENVSADDIPQKNNYLMVGPTGSGKTYLIELLFKHILKIPTVIVDITNYSETGYVGQDVMSILTRLFMAAEYDPELTTIGVVCIDEFDKIAGGNNSALFAGAGTTKDVTGFGVQRELLKILESNELIISNEITHNSYSQQILISTRNICFIGAGAFSGFKFVSGASNMTTMGFDRLSSIKDYKKIAAEYNSEEIENLSNYYQYGFLPELIARFGRIIPFKPLSEIDLKTILYENIIKKYQKDFSLDDIELTIEEKVLDIIVKKALKRETGARGLESILLKSLEKASFEIFSSKKCKKVNLVLKNGQICYDIA